MQNLKPHKTAVEIAKKHGVDVSVIHKQLKIGIPIEHEHTKNNDIATDIALQHLDEFPNYYTKLKKMEKSLKSVKEEKEESKYCALCDKVEKRSECSYGKKAWDAVTSSESFQHSITSKVLKKVLDEGPCWKGYKQIGMKTKNGKKVPNCVPVNNTKEEIESPIEEGYKNIARKAGVMTQKAAKLGVQAGASKMAAHALETGGLRNAVRSKLGLEPKKREGKEGVSELKSKSKKYSERAAKIAAVQQHHKPGISQEKEKINRERGKIKNIQKLDKIYNKEDISIEDLNGNTFANIVDIIKPEPIKGFKSRLKEATLLKSKSGNVVSVTLSWRGKYYGLKLFFPQIKTPTRKEINTELQKVYPGSVVIHYYISDMDLNQPLFQSLGPQTGSSPKIGSDNNYIKPMS